MTKVINLKDKKNEIINKQLNENTINYIKESSEVLYDYIKLKIRFSFMIGIPLDSDNLEFLKNVNNEDAFVSAITNDCMVKLVDIISTSIGEQCLIHIDNLINDYLVNNVFCRLEDWSKEVLNRGV